VILNFTVKNYKSFSDEQYISLVANSGKELPDNTCHIANSQISCVKTAVIYGPNASGKSNFIKAIDAMRKIVLNENIFSDLAVDPFALSSQFSDKPTEFEINVVINDLRYNYGFSCTKKKIYSEWLYVFPKITNKKQVWFERVFNDETCEYEWNLTNHIKGKRTFIKDTTGEKALFLTKAYASNSESVKPLVEWFQKSLLIFNANTMNYDYQLSLLQEKLKQSDFIDKIRTFLKAADIKINDISFEEKSSDVGKNNTVDRTILTSSALDNLSKHYRINTVHKDDVGNDVVFDFFKSESDGTKKLFVYAFPIIEALQNGSVIVVDELNLSIHPKILKFIISLFHNSNVNFNNAQLIFTTHETSVLDNEIFRRDQIWFTTLTEKQNTRLYPLTDFKPLKGKDKFETRYLNGRYGALPYVDTYLFEKLVNMSLLKNNKKQTEL